MRLDPPGLTGPPTAKGTQNRERKEKKKDHLRRLRRLAVTFVSSRGRARPAHRLRLSIRAIATKSLFPRKRESIRDATINLPIENARLVDPRALRRRRCPENAHRANLSQDNGTINLERQNRVTEARTKSYGIKRYATAFQVSRETLYHGVVLAPAHTIAASCRNDRAERKCELWSLENDQKKEHDYLSSLSFGDDDRKEQRRRQNDTLVRLTRDERCPDCSLPSLQRQTSRPSYKTNEKSGRTRRGRHVSSIVEEDLPEFVRNITTDESSESPSVSPVDLLVYTAFNDDDDDDDDENVDVDIINDIDVPRGPDHEEAIRNIESRDHSSRFQLAILERTNVYGADEEAQEKDKEKDSRLSILEVDPTHETTTCVTVPGGLLHPLYNRARVTSRVSCREKNVAFNCGDQKKSLRDTLLSTDDENRRLGPRGRCYELWKKDRCSKMDNYEYLYDIDQFGDEQNQRISGGRWCDNTARFPKPIIKRKQESQKSEIDLEKYVKSSKRRRRGRNCSLLFILYLLAWPLLCTTNPSGQLASAFAEKLPINHADGHVQHNVTVSQSIFSSASTVVVHQNQQEQEYMQDTGYSEYDGDDRDRDEVKGNARRRREEGQHRGHEREQRQGQQVVAEEKEVSHPYNEYTWEVNQINPWLSACDLAGPAPADLQGSCGPPEVPKNCPGPCVSRSRDGVDAVFFDVIERLEAEKNDDGRRWSSKKSRTKDGQTMILDTGGKADSGYADRARTPPEQCLFYLEESHKKDICRDDFGRASTRSFLTPRENRYRFMSGLRLRHCCEHAVVNALAPGKGGPLEDVLHGGRKCADALDKLLLVDALAARLHCEFEEVLARYDCAQSYSVIHKCTHCKEAYRKWVCSSLVPYFAHGGPLDLEPKPGGWSGTRIRPCRSFCQSVEQRCPYLLPGDRAPAYPTQYAGEPTFLCRDPNIPETGEQAARALHSSDEDECCFHTCSEEEPGSGICANCTDRVPRGRIYDPPTAPQCDVSPAQSVPTGQQSLGSSSMGSSSTETSVDQAGTSTSTSSTVNVQQQRASFCGSGGVRLISSGSSPSRSKPSIILRLLSICSIIMMLRRNTRTIVEIILSSRIDDGSRELFGSPGSFIVKRTMNLLIDCSSRSRHLMKRSILWISITSKKLTIERWYRGWWWWRSWRRSSSRHFRWKDLWRSRTDRVDPSSDLLSNSRAGNDQRIINSNERFSSQGQRLRSLSNEDGIDSSRFLGISRMLRTVEVKWWCRGWWWWCWRSWTRFEFLGKREDNRKNEWSSSPVGPSRRIHHRRRQRRRRRKKRRRGRRKWKEIKQRIKDPGVLENSIVRSLRSSWWSLRKDPP